MMHEQSTANPNTREHSEHAFCPGGIWEQAGGREQTRLFAQYFHKNVSVPLAGDFSVLDVGCALGDALPVWHECYPEARLFGCDVAQAAIDRCILLYGSVAQFFRASFEEIQGFWDVIYCSNVLEHFENYLDIAAKLLTCCRILYVMTPYAELRNGKLLRPDGLSFHVTTLFEDSFAPLANDGSCRITTKIIRAPGAWGPSWRGEALWRGRELLGRKHGSPPRQIIFSIHNAGRP